MSAMSRQRSGIKGVSNVRRALRGAIPAIRKPVVEAIEELATETEQVMRYMAPRDEGDLISSITHVTSTDGLSAVVGPGIRGATTVKKRTGSYFSTAKIEGGGAVSLTSKNVKVINFAAQTNFDRFQLMKAYWLEVGTKKMRRHPFVEPTFDSVKGKVVSGIGMAVDTALSRILSGHYG